MGVASSRTCGGWSTRGEREGLRLVEDDDFDAFFRLHEGTHERKGAAIYLPRPAFETWFRRLRAAGRCRLYHARRVRTATRLPRSSS